MEGLLKVIGYIVVIFAGLLLLEKVVFPLLEMLARLVSSLMLLALALGVVWFVFMLIRNLFRS
jgi:hypothetical protein